MNLLRETASERKRVRKNYSNLSPVYSAINLHQNAIYPTTGRVGGKSIFSAVGRLGWSELTWSWAKLFVDCCCCCCCWLMQGGGFIAGKLGTGWESSITLTPFTWPSSWKKEAISWINYQFVHNVCAKNLYSLTNSRTSKSVAEQRIGRMMRLRWHVHTIRHTIRSTVVIALPPHLLHRQHSSSFLG